MDVKTTLRMNGGLGPTSYANNSLPQRSLILKTKPFIQEAIQELLTTTTTTTTSPPKCLNIADLGCASGPNSLLPLTLILDAVHETCSSSTPEFHVSLNDLPGNDFNSVITAVPSFCQKLREEKGDEFGPCFISATPGSFHDRLFPCESLHFVYCANSLQWLSQVPRVADLNKGNVAIGRNSPATVFQVHFEQFKRDFTAFLDSRAQEMVPGGRMILANVGRRNIDPLAEECYYVWDDLACALRQLVAEGGVPEAKLESFSFPYYELHVEELREVIRAEGSFEIVRIEALDRATELKGDASSRAIDYGVMASCFRAITEPMLASHFGGGMIGELFKRFEARLSQRDTHAFTAIVVSLARNC